MLKKLLLPFLFIAFCVNMTFAQTGSISGTVTNPNGEPIPTANVLLVEISRGAATNMQGEYTIKGVQPGTYTLRVTFVGYKDYTTEVTIKSGETLQKDVQLKKGGLELDELVVTAFNISREKESLGYQSETVGAADLNSSQATTAAASLTGKVAGLQINNTGSGVKPNNQILLRGVRSITGNNAALIVIDGAIATQGAFSALNPGSIESINVLKGATAAALYGSDASNGVLVVTTKNGKKGEGFTAGYRHSTMWKDIAYLPDMQTKFGGGWAGDYSPIENTNWGMRLDGEVRRIGPDFPKGYRMKDQMVPYSFVSNQLLNFFNTGMTNQNTIYLSGGNETSSFYLSLGNTNTNGVIPNNEYKRKTITANATKTIGDVTLKVNTSYFQDKRDVVGGNVGGQGRAIYWSILNTPINIPLTKYKDWQNPNSYAYKDHYYNAYYRNPYAAIGNHRNIDENNRLRGNISASWDIVENINITGRLGIDTYWGHGKAWRGAVHYNSDLRPSMTDISSYVEDSEFQNTLITGNVIASGDFQLSEDIGLKANVGASVKMDNHRESEIRANNLSLPNFFDISNGTGQPVVDADESHYRTYGFFGSFTFDYQQWVYLTLTGRQDFTSTLPADQNSYFYPGAGLSLVLNEAIPAIGDISAISLLKITANYSIVYNDLNPYAVTERYYQPNSFPFGGVNGFHLDETAVDSGIQKEKVTTTEFGLNAAFFNNRLTFDAAYYFTNTTNLITSVSASQASGSDYYLTNIGQLSGQGIELSLGGDIVRSEGFTWHMNVNYTHYKSVVDEIKPGVDEIAVFTNSGYGIYAIKGMVFPQLKAVSYVRDPQGRVVINPETGNPLIGDVQPMGQTTPNHVMGFNTSLHYKGFTLNATADFRTGYVYYAMGQDVMSFTGRTVESAAANRQNFVFPNSSYPDPNGPGYIANKNIPISGGVMPFWINHYSEIKENYVKDATAFKLRSVSLSYDVPVELLSKTNAISKLTVSLIANNLITILPQDQTTFSDPEFKDYTQSDDSDYGNAIGIGGYLTPPPTRSYGFSVNIEF